MIAFVSGMLDSVEENAAVVNVGGMGCRVFMTGAGLSALPPRGETVKLYTYLRLGEDGGLGWGAIAGVWGSPAALAIAPLQDVLGLGGDARMNTPGTVGGQNWRWRVREEALNGEVAVRLREMTRVYGRLSAKRQG